MNKQKIYDRGFLNGMAAMSITGLLFTIIINITGQRFEAGYIIFGIPVVFKLVIWFIDIVMGGKE